MPPPRLREGQKCARDCASSVEGGLTCIMAGWRSMVRTGFLEGVLEVILERQSGHQTCKEGRRYSEGTPGVKAGLGNHREANH